MERECVGSELSGRTASQSTPEGRARPGQRAPGGKWGEGSWLWPGAAAPTDLGEVRSWVPTKHGDFHGHGSGGLPGSLHLGLRLCFLVHLTWSLFWILKGGCFQKGGWIFLPCSSLEPGLGTAARRERKWREGCDGRGRARPGRDLRRLQDWPEEGSRAAGTHPGSQEPCHELPTRPPVPVPHGLRRSPENWKPDSASELVWG